MATNQLYPRILEVSVEINGQIQTFEGAYIHASGTKFANAIDNECQIEIGNFNEQTRNFILTESSPYNKNRTPKSVTVTAGYANKGTSVIFTGNITSVSITQPPDQTITIKASTLGYLKGAITSRYIIGTANLRNISAGIASDLNLSLNFQAVDGAVNNYNFVGSALKQVNLLGTLGQIDAYVDNNTLVVKNKRIPLSNSLRILNADSGMIGLPELTELGIKVTYLVDNVSVLGGALQIMSSVNPTLNGTYIIYKLGFDLFNRDNNFYYIAEALRYSAN